MTVPHSLDRPGAETPQSPTPPVVDPAPPLAPKSSDHSPWWSAPSGKPFNIPDFAHELRMMLVAVFAAPQTIPLRAKARR